jgi:hypothetical protein
MLATFFQYNKSKGKAHPFEICGVLDWDVIKEKLTKLKERAATDEVTTFLTHPS